MKYIEIKNGLPIGYRIMSPNENPDKQFGDMVLYEDGWHACLADGMLSAREIKEINPKVLNYARRIRI